MTPKPKVVSTVCTECGLDWAKHKSDAKGVVKLDECVRLLKAALAAKPMTMYLPTYTGTTGTTFSTGGPNL